RRSRRTRRRRSRTRPASGSAGSRMSPTSWSSTGTRSSARATRSSSNGSARSADGTARRSRWLAGAGGSVVRVARTATPGDPAATDGRVTPPGTGEGVRGEGLTKRYGDLLAVDDVSVSLGKGHTLVLLGPSGSGKTTLLRLIAGLERPTSGRVYFGDTDVTDLPLRRRGVGM